ncbi:IPT/TIG domain-containing protein [Formosa sp. A9]|uniref:IPT/TIG domain-containing protein n=1 Tax=Formosa sp. A9 TaxID=3442641 RepID=UPI003EBB94A8
MTKKITQLKFINLTNIILLFLLVMVSSKLIAQTVTEVFPTRVTTNSKITIVGSGFTGSTSISIPGVSIKSGSKEFVSSMEMTFEISESGNDDVSAELLVGGNATSFYVDYVAPSVKILDNGANNNIARITEIFTTYNGFWRSSQWKADPENEDLMPNTRHDLLAFTYDGVTYSTGVNDDLLIEKGVTFNSQLFYAYSTNGVDGSTYPLNYLAMADMIDGEVNEGVEITSPEILNATIYENLIDGVNGLDLGTGVTNFNQLADVGFYSSGGQLGGISDGAPDFLITQIAKAGSIDVYYYADDAGNVVGRPIKLSIIQEEVEDYAGDGLLAIWRLDLFTLQSGLNYGVAKPQKRTYTGDETRPLRMAAFRFEDFEITADNVTEINNINMVAGGTADLAFLAYNRGSFDIKTPVITKYPVPNYVCSTPSNKDIIFTATAQVSGNATGSADEELSYQWYKYNTPIPGEQSNTLTISGEITTDDLGTYKLQVSNSFGSVFTAVSLSKGGVPVYWDGVTWQLPPSYVNAGITVEPENRRFIFSSNYNKMGDLEGCDCVIPSGSSATIPSRSTLKLRGSVSVETDGALILEDGANLIQMNDESDSNMNSGNITMQRYVRNIIDEDFIMWSSPVINYNVNTITTPYTTPAYQWDVNDGWIAFGGIMEPAEGYAVQIPQEFVFPWFTASFKGVPFNGSKTAAVSKSNSVDLKVEQQHWNLIGNPYPSAISVDEFISENSILNGSIRLWADNLMISNVPSPLSSSSYSSLRYNFNEQYMSYNATGVNPPQTSIGNISSGQGFFVQVNDAASAGDVIFTNDMRYDDDGMAYDNTHFFTTNVPTNNTENKQLLWLSLIDAGNSSASALIGYVQGATLGKDKKYDAYSDLQDFDIYTTVEDTKMVIQGRPLPFNDADTIPIGINLPSTGSYKIAIGDLSGTQFLDNAQSIYLEDTVLNIEHDLRMSPYLFTAEAGELNNRFVLRYTKTLSVSEYANSQTFVNIFNGVLNVKSFKNIESVVVYDISGKQVVSYNLKTFKPDFSESFKFSKGVYLATIKLQGGIMVTKKVVN